MADYDETDDFDRLANEPDDPIAATREIVSSTAGVRGDTSIEIGDVSLSDLSQVEPPAPRPSPVPWMVAAALLVVVVVLIFGFVVPARSTVASVQDELEAARAELIELRERVTTLTSERDELLEARAALEAEAEVRAGEIDQLARAAEARDAEERKAAMATKNRRKIKRKKRKRR